MRYKTFFDEHHLYFITCTIAGWKHLFAIPAYAQIVLSSLDWLRRYGHMHLFAFVVMPSHLHVIIKPLQGNADALVQRFASFTAHEVLKRLRADNEEKLLAFFRGAAQQDHDRMHRIWQETLAEDIYSEKFLFQKMDLAASYAYADSIYDLPLLEMLGHPVAVYPEARLAPHG